VAAAAVDEFDRQVETLIQRGYPALAGVSAAELAETIEPLRGAVGPAAAADPYAIVVTGVPAAAAIEQVERRQKRASTVLDADDLARFEPTEDAKLPSASAYVITGVETGADTRNVTPDDALDVIRARGRFPLTIEEGIALVTHHPESVATNGGFSLLASRCGDRRVTALWISAGRPKLGWCWAGNPHTWLGSASCAARIAA
jgi:hypothetical protein